MFVEGQAVIIDTALGGIETGIYKQALRAIPDTHEVWVDGMATRSRIVWTSKISPIN